MTLFKIKIDNDKYAAQEMYSKMKYLSETRSDVKISFDLKSLSGHFSSLARYNGIPAYTFGKIDGEIDLEKGDFLVQMKLSNSFYIVSIAWIICIILFVDSARIIDYIFLLSAVPLWLLWMVREGKI